MQICVDFDGTITTHEYPNIGAPIGAIEVLKELQEKGHQLILFTMRSGKELQEAVDYLKSEGVELYGINENPTQKNWTQSPKAYGQLYIDDAALGIPLTYWYMDKVSTEGGRPFVCWIRVRQLLVEKGLL